MSLTNLGLSGLTAAQNRLITTGHNIDNAATEGYNRQTVAVETAGARATSAGYYGRGVQVVTVQRAYDNFMYRQLVNAETAQASFTSYQNEITQVNNLFADRTVGISPAMQKFFDGVHAVASAPADSAARQEMLGRANSLAAQINDTNAFLNNQRNNINTQLTTLVSQINSQAERVNSLNLQIAQARASSSSHEPNDLLDQRDQVVRELSQLVGVTVIEQEGKYNLTLGGGQTLLGGTSVFPLQAVPASGDPSRLVVAATATGSGGTPVAKIIDETRLTGGQLGGLLQYRRESLDAVQNELGRLAVGLTHAFNSVHATGADLAGTAGGEFFRIGDITAVPGKNNSGTGPAVTAAITTAGDLSAQDYEIRLTDATAPGTYTITRLPDGQAQTYTVDAGQEIEIDGVTFGNLNGAHTAGDSWVVQPTRQAAAQFSVSISDPAKIAVAKPNTGTANGEIGLQLAQLQTAKIMGSGSLSPNEAFSQIVNRVAVQAQQNATSVKAQEALVAQNLKTQQSLSGVNLNEEFVNLERFQEQFRAASRLIDVSSKLFETLINLRS